MSLLEKLMYRPQKSTMGAPARAQNTYKTLESENQQQAKPKNSKLSY